MKLIDERKMIIEKLDALVQSYGLRIILRLQCIRCGDVFTEDEIDKAYMHIQTCRGAIK